MPPEKPNFVGRACIVFCPGKDFAGLLPGDGKAFVVDYVDGLLACQSMEPRSSGDDCPAMVWVPIGHITAILIVTNDRALIWQREARFDFGFEEDGSYAARTRQHHD
jgi:hypothetical protein